ncbi:MAG TPA: hypothetical protein VEW42_06075 [Candidatus Eisenbacteria bacterium]|nr:hypothetical protein [Candidatus Eisenbacteria bacterium]
MTSADKFINDRQKFENKRKSDEKEGEKPKRRGKLIRISPSRKPSPFFPDNMGI